MTICIWILVYLLSLTCHKSYLVHLFIKDMRFSSFYQIQNHKINSSSKIPPPSVKEQSFCAPIKPEPRISSTPKGRIQNQFDSISTSHFPFLSSRGLVSTVKLSEGITYKLCSRLLHVWDEKKFPLCSNLKNMNADTQIAFGTGSGLFLLFFYYSLQQDIKKNGREHGLGKISYLYYSLFTVKPICLGIAFVWRMEWSFRTDYWLHLL